VGAVFAVTILVRHPLMPIYLSILQKVVT